MKPSIRLSDYNTLRNLIQNLGSGSRTKEIVLLAQELDKATVLSDTTLGEKIVTLNSRVEIEDVASGRTTSLTIVLPEQGNLKEKKVSVLAPMSIALLGFKEGDSFEWQMPGGLKRIRIIRVINDQSDQNPEITSDQQLLSMTNV